MLYISHSGQSIAVILEYFDYIGMFFIGISLKLSSESLYELYNVGVYGKHILGNFNIILILAAVAIAMRLSKLSIAIIVILTIDLLFFGAVSPIYHAIRIMRIFFVGYMLIIYILVFDSKNAAKGLRLPNRITKEEQRAINMLIRLNESNKEKAISLLSRLSSTQQEELRNNVKEYYHQQHLRTVNLLSICPLLTPSEIEICQQILMGKSLKEICSYLHKTSSNITSQRTHIRKKLNLTKHQDLRIALTTLLDKLENPMTEN